MIRSYFLILLLAVASCRPAEEQKNISDLAEVAQDIAKEDNTHTIIPKPGGVKTPVEEEKAVGKKEEKIIDAEKTIPPKKEVIVEQAVVPAKSSISFTETVHNFGRVTEGDTVKHIFAFTNKGNANLLIKNVIVDCGCTTPEYTREPIAPGETGTISIEFDTHGKLSSQSRMITVVTNGDPVSRILRLEGVVGTD